MSTSPNNEKSPAGAIALLIALFVFAGIFLVLLGSKHSVATSCEYAGAAAFLALTLAAILSLDL